MLLKARIKEEYEIFERIKKELDDSQYDEDKEIYVVVVREQNLKQFNEYKGTIETHLFFCVNELQIKYICEEFDKKHKNIDIKVLEGISKKKIKDMEKWLQERYKHNEVGKRNKKTTN